MHTKFSPRPLAVALLLAGLGSWSLPMVAATVQEDVSISPAHSITASDEAVISSAAVKVLRHVAEARGQLQGDEPDADAAATELDKAEKLLDIIQASLPTAEVKDRIWIAQKHLEYEDSEEVLPDLVPIFTSLDELADYMPVDQAKGHLDKAKQAVNEGQKDEARAQLQQVDEALVYVEADLPLHSTRALVDQAHADLAKGDIKGADQALRSAEDNVVLISVAFDSPLIQAKSALWQARVSYDLGDKANAKASLQQAVAALERAGNSKDQLMRDQAGRLIDQVRDVERLLTTDDTGFSAGVEQVWQRVQALSERTAEYVSTGWERLRAKNPGKEDLIEAKLYVAYSRVDSEVAKDTAAAKVDLAEAKGYLGAAATKVGAEAKPKLDAIVVRIDDLDRMLAQGSGKAPDATAFHEVETGLSALIRKL